MKTKTKEYENRKDILRNSVAISVLPNSTHKKIMEDITSDIGII